MNVTKTGLVAVLVATMTLAVLIGCGSNRDLETAASASVGPQSQSGTAQDRPQAGGGEPMEDGVSMTIAVQEGGGKMPEYDFSAFTDVEIMGVDLSALDDEGLSVLYRQARFCQAMTEADTDTMAELVAEDVTFTHMTGMRQTRAEYFAYVASGRLRYYAIGIENPKIEVDGEFASIRYTSVLNAEAYGSRGTFRIEGTHRFERIDGEWVATNRAMQR